MSYLHKVSIATTRKTRSVVASSDAVPALIRALAQTIGNKRYLHDLEDLLKKLEPLSSFENETLWYLIRDLKNQ